MANEITVSGSLGFTKGTKTATLKGNQKIDMTGDHYVQRVDDIGTSEETVSKGDIVTLGMVSFKNVGDNGTIQIGGATGSYSIKLDPGDYQPPIKWATNAIYAISDVPGKLEMLLLEK